MQSLVSQPLPSTGYRCYPGRGSSQDILILSYFKFIYQLSSLYTKWSRFVVWWLLPSRLLVMYVGSNYEGQQNTTAVEAALESVM
jgi:hypothetical protein